MQSAASGDESDLQAWVEFDAQIKRRRRLRAQRSPRPGRARGSPGSDAIAGHEIGDAWSVGRSPKASGRSRLLHHGSPRHGRRRYMGEQVANTYGYVEVRELLQF
jgi:hypothetical protein